MSFLFEKYFNDERIKSQRLMLMMLVATIFYGDVYFFIVIPLSMLMTGGIFFQVLIEGRLIRNGKNIGIFFLAGLVVLVGIQTVGFQKNFDRTDWAVYLPIIYAVFILYVCEGKVLSIKDFWESLKLGGIILGFVMICAFIFVPVSSAIIPGQSTVLSDQERQVYEKSLPPAEKKTYEALMQNSNASYYEIKSRVKTALGQSNYIAVFFLFLFCVSLFDGRYLFAVIFAILTFATLSRAGGIFVILAFLIWLVCGLSNAWRIFFGLLALITVFSFISLICFNVIPIKNIPSVQERLVLMQNALLPIKENFVFGMPRSEAALRYGQEIMQSPHNSVIKIALLFGVGGLVLYAAYVIVAMRCIYRQAKNFSIWRGIFVGLLLIYVWSLGEIIVLTPGFEILVALLYAFARSFDQLKLRDSII